MRFFIHRFTEAEAMLVLSRKLNERVIIGGGEVVVTVVEVREGRVRLGFDAPKHVTVHREEVQLEITQGPRDPEKPLPMC